MPKISMAQWSLNRAFFAKTLNPIDFASIAKNDYDISAIEYVNQFYTENAKDEKFWKEMTTRASDVGVESLIMMVDEEEKLGDTVTTKRKKAIEDHFKWVNAAKILGCHSIRVNAGSSGSYEEQIHRAADGLRALSEFGDKHEINVIVENHGGLSSNGDWLSTVIKKVDHKRCGTLPDFVITTTRDVRVAEIIGVGTETGS